MCTMNRLLHILHVSIVLSIIICVSFHLECVTSLSSIKNNYNYNSSSSSSSRKNKNGADDEEQQKEKEFWEVAPTLMRPKAQPLPSKLYKAMTENVHPYEIQDELGEGVFITDDWRKAWFTYEQEGLIDPDTGRAEYEIDEIDGTLPIDLVGTVYRNGPGKFGVNQERVAHVLDADGLIIQISIPPVSGKNERRKVYFKSRFVETKGLASDRNAGEFTQRGTFGTSIRGLSSLFPGERKGLNSDPSPQPLMSRIFGNAFNTDIKNTANTQVISFGGKLLALFEAGLPYELDPLTMDTIGEYDMGGTLTPGKIAVKVNEIPEGQGPDFIGGAAHTAHPNVCPKTGHLVGWSWSQLPIEKKLEVRVTEWESQKFSKIAEKIYVLDNCELAPHDMALTDDALIFKVNSLSMDPAAYMSGMKGPAAALSMDGRAPVTVHILPRPCAENSFEPFSVEVPACFSIHFSHAYKDKVSGNIVTHFSGWPPNDSKDFLGAWGGLAPHFAVIPPTYIWRLEIDPSKKKTVDLQVARGSSNCCAEHPLVHPNFTTSKANNVFAVGSNLNGDSTAPCGYVKLKVESGSSNILKVGEKNTDVDAYWFGTRCFAGEPLIVPKQGGDLENEDDAFLVGMVQDSVKKRSFLAVFDLQRPLRNGPVCKLWMKSSIPHGLHGCFDNTNGKSSYFC